MQKFTRPLTREIEVAGERLALTLHDQGLSVRPVGSRKPPWEFPWATVLHQLIGSGTTVGPQPTAEQLAATLELLKKGQAGESVATPGPRAEPAPSLPPATPEAPEAGPAATPALVPAQEEGPSPGGASVPAREGI